MNADTDENFEPEPEDWITSDHSHFYSDGKLILHVEPDATPAKMWEAIDRKMRADNFFPNVWFVSDHGNAHLMARPKRKRSRRARHPKAGY